MLDTELLKADEKQDEVARSKAATFLKAAMQKEKILEDLTIAQSKIERIWKLWHDKIDDYVFNNLCTLRGGFVNSY